MDQPAENVSAAHAFEIDHVIARRMQVERWSLLERPVGLCSLRYETSAVGCHRLPIGLFEPFSAAPICDRLPPVAPARLHKRSMPWLC